MSRHRQALYVCLAGGPIMIGTMLINGNSLSKSLIVGFVTMIIALVGMHLGLWVKSTDR